MNPPINMPDGRACVVCGSSQATELFSAQDRLLDLTGTFRFVRCLRCGLIYVDPQPTWEQRARHYPPEYRGYHTTAQDRSQVQRRAWSYGMEKRRRIIAAHSRGGRLLDIGCGGGEFAAYMEQYGGWKVVAVESSSAMAQTARVCQGVDVVIGDGLQLGFADATCDVVTLWAVLEHMADPRQGLAECVRVLRPGGLLVVRTLMAESWGARLFGANWVGYDAPRVLFVFPQATLRILMEESGAAVVGIGSHFHDFHPFLWSLRNLCLDQLCSPALCARIDRVAHSWLVRLATLPFFAWQTRQGGNSFVTVTALKP
jgi:2-polyprenyl-3-methyl-5-hydroxy-6-metoxy-1,4-benzoquinol methylase